MDRTAAAMDDFSASPDAGDRYRAFMAESAKMDELTDEFFFWKPVGSYEDMVDGDMSAFLETLRSLSDMRIGRTVAGRVRHYLDDPRLAQMADHFTQYVGSSPFLAPAILCGIAHMQTDGGIWYPRGGIRAVPEALAELASDLGAELHTGRAVRRIVTDEGAIRGIETEDGNTVEGAAVVCNADCVRAHRELIDEPAGNGFLGRRDYEPACSGVVLYLGLTRRYESLMHHNFVFSRDAEEEFHHIYERRRPAPDPTCYVCAPSRTDPDAAPEGCETLYVLTHTPALKPHHHWGEMLPPYRERILDKLEKTAGLRDIRDYIAVEHVLTPEDIKDAYAVLDGSIYGLASHGRFRGAMKPTNRSPDLAGLYLAGGSVHPGAGMPMALMSGWIAADALCKDGIA